MSSMAYEVTIDAPYDQSLQRVIDALKVEGFGVLTRIDVHDAFREKLGVEFRNYSILGACNPSLAHKALSSRPDAGLMSVGCATMRRVTPHSPSSTSWFPMAT